MKNLLRIIVVLVLAACGPKDVQSGDFGGQYLGAKYVLDPLGEGAGYDADPVFRTDAFDCQTYVETVLACGDVARLDAIRYQDGEVDFIKRNHFFTADWLPNNKNLVENVSGEFGVAATRSGTIDKKSWFQKNHGIKTDFVPRRVAVQYVPYSEIVKYDTSAPVLVAFVVDNPATVGRIGSDILVSHVGFLLPGGVLRHASSGAGKVIDTNFQEYAKTRAQTATNIGVAFFKIKEFCQ